MTTLRPRLTDDKIVNPSIAIDGNQVRFRGVSAAIIDENLPPSWRQAFKEALTFGEYEPWDDDVKGAVEDFMEWSLGDGLGTLLDNLEKSAEDGELWAAAALFMAEYWGADKYKEFSKKHKKNK